MKLKAIAWAFVKMLGDDLGKPENRGSNATIFNITKSIASIASIGAFTSFKNGITTRKQRKYVYDKALLLANRYLPTIWEK